MKKSSKAKAAATIQTAPKFIIELAFQGRFTGGNTLISDGRGKFWLADSRSNQSSEDGDLLPVETVRGVIKLREATPDDLTAVTVREALAWAARCYAAAEDATGCPAALMRQAVIEFGGGCGDSGPVSPVVTVTLKPSQYGDVMRQAVVRRCSPGAALASFLERNDVWDIWSEWSTNEAPDKFKGDARN